MKTIKQLADEMGVSKTAVRKYMSDEVKTKFAETVSGVIYIHEQGETLIKSAFYKNKPQTTENQVTENHKEETANQTTNQTQVSSEVSALIEMLQRELEVKNKQIEELTTTIRLQAESINTDRKNELAETIIDGQQAITGDNKNSKKSFWKFWKR